MKKSRILPRRESFRIIYYLPIREHRLTEEEASDFLIWFQSRLKSIEINYKNNKHEKNGTDLTFEEFLSSCVRKRCVNYLSERRRAEYVQNLTDQFYYRDSLQNDNTASYAGDSGSVAESYYSKTRARKSRLTTLILMFAPFIDYPEAIHMATMCKLDIEEFKKMYDSICRRYSEIYGTRAKKSIERRNVASLRMLLEEADEQPLSGRSSRYCRKSDKRRNRFDNAVPLKMVSEVQHIPYNTALSNLRIIRKEIGILSKKKDL